MKVNIYWSLPTLTKLNFVPIRQFVMLTIAVRYVNDQARPDKNRANRTNAFTIHNTVLDNKQTAFCVCVCARARYTFMNMSNCQPNKTIESVWVSELI